MDFSPNKMPIEIIKEGVFGRTYFRDIILVLMESGAEFDQLKDVDQKYYCSNYYGATVNKYGVKFGISLRFWENKGWINEIDPYDWFQWYWLCTGYVQRSEDDESQINRWKKIASRFRDKLVKMIKDAGSKLDDYSISSKIRQILLHWGYELTEKDFFIDLTS